MSDKIKALEPLARAFANKTYDFGMGTAVINFDNGVVIYVNNVVPGSAEFRLAIKKLMAGLQDVEGFGDPA